MDEDARTLLAQALDRHAARDTDASIDLSRRAVRADPNYVEALEHLGTLLVTRKRRYREGIEFLERAVSLRPDDPGLWYGLGWNREFAAHEMRRRDRTGAGVHDLYVAAADAFRRCLDLHPEGKLQGDAEDLLDHIENELASM